MNMWADRLTDESTGERRPCWALTTGTMTVAVAELPFSIFSVLTIAADLEMRLELAVKAHPPHPPVTARLVFYDHPRAVISADARPSRRSLGSEKDLTATDAPPTILDARSLKPRTLVLHQGRLRAFLSA